MQKVNLLFFGLLCIVEQQDIGSFMFAEQYRIVIRKRLSVALQIFMQLAVFSGGQVAVHDGDMMPEIVPRLTGGGNLPVQIFILKALNFKLVVLRCQLTAFLQFIDQTDNGVIDQKGAQIGEQGKEYSGEFQCVFQRRRPILIIEIIPQQIEGGRNQPQIIPGGGSGVLVDPIRVVFVEIQR